MTIIISGACIRSDFMSIETALKLSDECKVRNLYFVETMEHTIVGNLSYSSKEAYDSEEHKLTEADNVGYALRSVVPLLDKLEIFQYDTGMYAIKKHKSKISF